MIPVATGGVCRLHNPRWADLRLLLFDEFRVIFRDVLVDSRVQ
jgi:hypothetical protein